MSYYYSSIITQFIPYSLPMKVQTTSEVRKHFQEVIDHVHYTKTPMIISKNNKPWVMVQALPEDDSVLQDVVDTEGSGEK